MENLIIKVIFGIIVKFVKENLKQHLPKLKEHGIAKHVIMM